MEIEEIDRISTFRSMYPEDEAFIFSTWLKGLYYGNSWFREIEKSVFMENYHKLIEATIKRPGVEVSIACLRQDEGTILGYSVVERNRSAIHWVYVKEVWRKFGLMKRLIPQDQKWVCVTHLTTVGKAVKPKEIKFNPFIV